MAINGIEFPIAVDRDMDLSKEIAGRPLAGISTLDYDEFLVSDHWKWGDDTRYAFAAGYIRAVEHRLISPERLVRLTEARSVPELFAMLGDTDYARTHRDDVTLISGADSNGIDIGEILRQEAERVKALINELTQDRELTDTLFVRDDYFNLKLAIKGIAGNVPVEHSFAPLGMLPAGLIYQEARSPEKSELLPAHLREAAVRAARAFADTKSPMEIDRVIDAHMYEYLLTMASRKGTFFFNKLVAAEIDLTNIVTFFRVKWTGGTLSALQQSLINGGRLPSSLFLELYGREIDDIETGFPSNDGYGEFVAEGVSYLRNKASFVMMEALVDRELMKIIVREREIGFGVEILIAYYYKKSIEMKRLRTVAICKENGIPGDEIRTRLGYAG